MLERILRFSIQRRWIVVLVALAAAGAGLFALPRLPVDAVPDITNNQVQINTLVTSLSPLEIEQQVTFPIETALAGIPGLEYTRSLSRNGFSQVTAVFAEDVNLYFARNQVSERLAEAREALPAAADPRLGAISTGLGEVYMWTVTFSPRGDTAGTAGAPGWQPDGTYRTPEGEILASDFERATYLRTVQDWVIRPQLKGVPGVAGVDAIGGFVKQYAIEPDPRRLVSYGLTFTDLVEALESNNLNTGAGYIEHRGESYVVRASGRLRHPAEIETIVLGTHDGAPIYVRDVATVGLGRELRTGSATENGQEVVVGTALMLIGANSRTVASAVDARMRAVRASLPPGIEATTVLNRTRLVDATIATVTRNLSEGALLVVVVLFLLLGNLRAACITALVIPLSMLLTATGMVQNRVSGNLMSLGAIDFGLIVDAAVITIENALRLLAQKQHELGRVLSPRERHRTVFEGARQVLGAQAFGQAIIIAVYVPLLTLSGVEGKMFRPMALTVIMALVAAFVLSLTLIPALAALGLGGRVQEKDVWPVRAARRLYAPALGWALRRRALVVALGLGVFALGLLVFRGLGREFVPTLDEKDIAMHAMRIPSTSLTQSTTMQLAVEKAVARFPEVAFVFSKTGTAEMAADPMPPNVSDTFIILKPATEWPDPHEPRERLRARIEAAVGQLPGNNYEFTQPIQMRFNELIAGVRSDVAIKVYGDDFEAMGRTAGRLAAILRTIPGATDVKVEQTTGLPLLDIEIDRAAIARYGLNVRDVQAVVAAAVGGQAAGEILEGDRRFDLVVRLPDDIRRDFDALGRLPIPLPAGDARDGNADRALLAADPGRLTAFVPLEAVARLRLTEGPNQVSRENGKRRVVVQANVRGRDLGSFVAEAQEKVRAVPLPPGGWLDWGGQFENLSAAQKRLQFVVPLCFLVIGVLLFSALGSAVQALIVFTGVPLGLTGGILALWGRGMPFSITAAVGFIALSGVAVLNGLVMITFINQLRREGLPLDEAIRRGCLTRLRPVLMTALVASLGFIPMALAHGTGAEVQKPLATVVIGGLVSSTLLTLFVLPALYRLLHRDGDAPAADAAEID